MTESIIVTTDLTRRYGYRTALKKVSFEIANKGIHALFGANGAGKTTLMRIIATLLRPHGGRISILGHNPEEEPLAIRKQIGLIGDKPLLYSELSGIENFQFFGKLYGLTRRHIDERAGELASTFDVKRWLHEPTKNLSTGLRKRMDIIRALLHDPVLLLLDEPFSGLDMESTEIFINLLDEVRKQKTALLTTHNIELGRRTSDSFITLRKGEIVSAGPISMFDGVM